MLTEADVIGVGFFYGLIFILVSAVPFLCCFLRFKFCKDEWFYSSSWYIFIFSFADSGTDGAYISL